MAFDGIVVSNIVRDMKERLEGGRIYKIYQPEADEINLVVKNNGGTHRLMLNASATLPLVYFLSENKNNPMTAPNFCMLLRKHIGNGRIIEVTQPEFERIISIEIEHLDEMGDVCRKKLIIELMGKYSNIIFTDNEGNIIDSVKRIGSQRCWKDKQTSKHCVKRLRLSVRMFVSSFLGVSTKRVTSFCRD